MCKLLMTILRFPSPPPRPPLKPILVALVQMLHAVLSPPGYLGLPLLPPFRSSPSSPLNQPRVSWTSSSLLLLLRPPLNSPKLAPGYLRLPPASFFLRVPPLNSHKLAPPFSQPLPKLPLTPPPLASGTTPPAPSSLPLALSRIAFRGKVIACGAISGYENATDTVALPVSSYLTIVYQEVSLHGVIFSGWFDRIPEISAQVMEWVMTRRFLPIKQQVELPIEEVSKGLEMLMGGGNVGKLVVKLV